MNLPKRTVYMLLLALVCANVLVRLPRTPHETGIDSFFVHSLAASISDAGRIPWVLNPLGYFGWYPLSYPSAMPLVISGTSQVTGLTAEGAILDLSILFGVIGALTGFAMARSFRRDDAFALLVAVLFSFAPRFLSFTLWSASSRNLFMVLIPVFVWLLIRTFRKPSVPNLILLISVLVTMIATHRLTILMAVVVIAFVVAYVFILLNRVIRIRFPKILLSQRVRRWTPRLALIGILGIAFFMLAEPGILAEYSTGEVCQGGTTVDQICNLGVSITRSVGLALPFALLGVMEVVRQRNKGFLEAFIILSLLALIPTLFLRQYTGFYILPFLSIFGAFGVMSLIRILARHRRARNAVAVSAILAITGFSIAVLEVEVGRGTSLSSATYGAALYLADLPKGNFVTNDGLFGIRIAAISGRHGLPLGGAGVTHQSPELLVMNAWTAEEVFAREERIALTDLTIEDDSPFILRGIDARFDWTDAIMKLPVDSISASLVHRYNLTYFVENDNYRDAYLGSSGFVYDRFLLPELVVFPPSVHELRYRVYDGPGADIYVAWPTLP